MVGVKDQDAVDRPGEHRVHLVVLRRNGEQHVQEILGVGQVVARIDERLSYRVFVGHRGDRRHLGDQPVRRDLALAAVIDVERVVIERAHRPHDADQHRHRMRVAPETAVEIGELLVQHGVVGDVVGKFLLLRPVGQVAV